MGFFSFFSKEKKETLDKGLSKTKESVFSKIARAVAGKSKVDDEVLDNLEEVLITSDVGVETTLNIIKRIEDTHYIQAIRNSFFIETFKNSIGIRNIAEEIASTRQCSEQRFAFHRFVYTTQTIPWRFIKITHH